MAKAAHTAYQGTPAQHTRGESGEALIRSRDRAISPVQDAEARGPHRD